MLRPVDRVCPLLALAVDARTVVDGVDPAHACHALAEPISLDRHLQAQLCLTPRHDRCERYLQHVAQRGGRPGRATVADGLVSTRMVLAPEPAWRGIAGRARRGRSGRAAVVGGAVLAATMAGAALARPALDGELSIVDAAPLSTPSPEPSLVTEPRVSASASPTLGPTATPTPPAPSQPAATAAPTATSDPTPTVAPTPAPTPAQTPAPTVTARTYVVEAGDTLAAIAQQFASSVAAIQAANGIEDPDEILVGQTLLIP